jgi:ATP-dependent HslUV protease ATP-binding subunit HslU
MTSLDMTPREIVRELDRYIVGQQDAKKAVAIAIRNRWRRQQLDEEIRNEISPKNIIMIGSTGVGKTEIARRLAGLVRAPFIKVEASKFTEVGYHGRDVESMIRDLVEVSMNLVQDEEMERVRADAERAAEERLLDLLLPAPPVTVGEGAEESEEKHARTREKMRGKLASGSLEENEVEISVDERKSTPMMQVFSNAGFEEFGVDLGSMLGQAMPSKMSRKRVTVAKARAILTAQEAEKLVDRDKIQREAMERAQQSGMIFLDEIDKIIGGSGNSKGPDVSREGVQRDLLPIVEGSTVNTRYGTARTDHILFVAAGAFMSANPTDLIPELQGRFPIRVELEDLKKEDFVRILTEPRNALTRQYTALMGAEGVNLNFTADGVEALAEIAFEANKKTSNIGARRLHTVVERVLEDVSFDAPDMSGKFNIDATYVRDKLADVLQDEDLSKYIL